MRQLTGTANVRLRKRNILILAGWSDVTRWRASWRIMEVFTVGRQENTAGRDRTLNRRSPGQTEKRITFTVT